MKPILITGAGLIGIAAARRCLREYEVHLLDHIDRSKELVATGLPIEFHQISINDRARLGVLISDLKPDAIVHTAAMLGPAFKADPATGYAVNIAGTVELACLALKAGISRFVYASSLAIYDFEQPDALLSEDAPKTTDDEYGFAKLFLEAWLLRAQARGLSPVILRFAGVYGNGPDASGGWSCARLRAVARAVADGDTVYLDEGQFGTNEYLHADDAAAAIAKAIKVDRAAICNIGAGKLTTAEELVAAFNRATGKANVVLQPAADGLPPHLQRCHPLDIRRAERVLDYRPRIDIEQGLRMLVSACAETI